MLSLIDLVRTAVYAALFLVPTMSTRSYRQLNYYVLCFPHYFEIVLFTKNRAVVTATCLYKRDWHLIGLWLTCVTVVSSCKDNFCVSL